MDPKALIRAALAARKFSHAPYSGFRVGAALLAKDGRVFTGCNIESASYSPTNCAERTALFKAVSEGVTEFTAIAVAGGKEPPEAEELADLAAPCGVCRQMLYEFNDGSMKVYIARSAEDYLETTLAELLPHAFGGGVLLEK